ncbi:hypothetical protein KBY91_19140 [Streptomyces sp. RK23]|uniref:hypothetical protein n=1 Tax=unclassified Streptomyces TaxID=2593676 RepID=UPI001B37AE7B|nr:MULTISPECIES: hypothetical protein [unclassified Streptomyces]MBQ0963466.1 hypothetical protein [Streptomyces sp. RK74B]MBQ1005522.1 hypothetical protein [Streptomyces sp. RK23]
MELTINRGAVHCVVGAPGLGKTWFGLGVAAEFLKADEEVTWFCWSCPPSPDSAATCIARLYQRLGLLGVGDRISRFHHYPNPPANWWPFKPYETSPTGLIVLDGMTAEHDNMAYVKPFHTTVPTATVLVTMSFRPGAERPEKPAQAPILGGSVVTLGATVDPTQDVFRIV